MPTFRPSQQVSETQRKRSLQQRMLFVHGFLALSLLIIVARLLELQVVKGEEYRQAAQSQHFGGVVLPARRGEILSRNSRTGETSILATNTTLDMVYVDPVIVDNPTFVAETLADLLVTDETHTLCTQGSWQCPRELVTFYAVAFDPLARVDRLGTGVLLEPIPDDELPVPLDALPDQTEVRRLFARDIESRIAEKAVRFMPLKYSATKEEMQAVRDLGIGGINVNWDQQLIYADPEEVNQLRLPTIARQLTEIVEIDPSALKRMLRSRPLRYVSVMHYLSPELSTALREIKATSLAETKRRRAEVSREAAQKINDPLRSVALIAEHWRFYPDRSVAAHVVGFLNASREAQYGIERTFNPELRGQDGRIAAVSDPTGGQILTNRQTIADPEDGDTIVLTIDRFVQKEIESIMEAAVKEYDADSGQVIVMEPETGRIIAMVNAPLFDGNRYGNVYNREPIFIPEHRRPEIVVELYHPQDNSFIVKGYIGDLFTESGRQTLTEETQQKIATVEQLYELEDMVRYYQYLGESSRREVFPTERPDVWLKYKNNIGVGAYLNRNVQEIYEPGSVIKAVTMAIAIDQGEVAPTDMYLDEEPVEVDEYTIRNALNNHFGEVTMTNCLEFSINTCMTTVSTKLGKKLFHQMLNRFGFGHITGIELEDELPGEILPWRKWSNALLATAAYGQGISATPLQVVTAFSALANDGKLMKPRIIETIAHSDGKVEEFRAHVVDQVIKPETSETITAMLTSTVSNGYAKTAKVPGYRIAGKTGTSQIARAGVGYESGTGSTITSFAGYAPIDDPRFTVLVKFNRPRKAEYGSDSAAPTFKDIAAFLFRYYGIPPDEV